MLRELLNEASHRDRAVERRRRQLPHHRTKRIDGDERGQPFPDLGDDALEDRVEASGGRFRGQIDEAHRRRNARRIKERELALVADHLDRRLAEHREVQRRAFGRGVREQHLLNERRLAGAGRSGDHIKGILTKAAPHDGVESGNAARDIPNERGFGRGHGACPSLRSAGRG